MTARSAAGCTVVDWVLLLLLLSGSFSAPLTVAVFRYTVPGSPTDVRTWTWIVQFAPLAKAARVQVTALTTNEHEPAAEVTPVTVSPPGTGSETTSEEASAGPLLVTARS